MNLITADIMKIEKYKYWETQRRKSLKTQNQLVVRNIKMCLVLLALRSIELQRQSLTYKI